MSCDLSIHALPLPCAAKWSDSWWRPVIKKLISNTDREESKPEECSYRTCWVIETLFGDPPQLSPSMVAVVTRKSCLPEPILCRNFTKHFLQWVPLTNVCQGLLPCDAWLMMVTDMGSHNDGHNDQWPLRPDRAPRSFFYPVIECQRPCEGKEREILNGHDEMKTNCFSSPVNKARHW